MMMLMMILMAAVAMAGEPAVALEAAFLLRMVPRALEEVVEDLYLNHRFLFQQQVLI